MTRHSFLSKFEKTAGNLIAWHQNHGSRVQAVAGKPRAPGPFFSGCSDPQARRSLATGIDSPIRATHCIARNHQAKGKRGSCLVAELRPQLHFHHLLPTYLLITYSSHPILVQTSASLPHDTRLALLFHFCSHFQSCIPPTPGYFLHGERQPSTASGRPDNLPNRELR